MKYILLTLTIASIFLSQTVPTKKDSILTSTQSIKETNQKLRNEIDNLKKLRDSLKTKLQSDLRGLYILQYGEGNGGKVAMGQVWTGMSEEMMKDSWGEPDSITVNDQKWGKYTQWYYGEITYFFKDGVLFEWESPKD
jgi:hypothetical protein